VSELLRRVVLAQGTHQATLTNDT